MNGTSPVDFRRAFFVSNAPILASRTYTYDVRDGRSIMSREIYVYNDNVSKGHSYVRKISANLCRRVYGNGGPILRAYKGARGRCYFANLEIGARLARKCPTFIFSPGRISRCRHYKSVRYSHTNDYRAYNNRVASSGRGRIRGGISRSNGKGVSRQSLHVTTNAWCTIARVMCDRNQRARDVGLRVWGDLIRRLQFHVRRKRRLSKGRGASSAS